MKAVIVTGATGYFGKYLVNGLKDGFQVIATSRSLDKLKQAFPEDDVIKAEMDAYDLEGMQKELERVCTEYEVVGLVNNAYDFSTKTGFNTPDGKYETIGLDEMRHGLESGLLAPMVACQVVGNFMQKKNLKGCLINISSMYGIVSPDRHLYEGKTVFNPVTYGVAKAGLNALTRYISSFWGGHGIRCNSVAPGAFPNVETDSVNAPKDDEFLKRLERKTTLGRVGHPTDLIGITKLLLSDEGSYITGQVISVDGGWSAI